jgi:dolichyl-phosphate beta-glucosyltransferase
VARVMERGHPGFTLVVPVFNEADRLPSTLPALVRLAEGLEGELLFVDDGSSDGTGDLLAGLARTTPDTVRLIRRTHRGKGAALSAGIQSARGEYIGFCDVDLATSLVDLVHLLDLARLEESLVIGSRAIKGSHIQVHERRSRELLGRAYNRLVQLRLTPGINDTQCGAKVASHNVWNSVLRHCRETGFAWDVEVVATALALGIGVREVPVTWSHDHRTKVNMIRDGVRMLTALAGISRRVAVLKRSSALRAHEDDSLGVLVDEAPVVEQA